MEDEIWKEIEGYNGMYEVSNKARIRSWKELKRNSLNQFIKGVKRSDTPTIMQTYESAHGYNVINLCINSEHKLKRLARLVAKSFVPNPNNKSEVNHIDGDKTNDMPSNLEWCTRSENMLHAFNSGLKTPVRGENHGSSKLTKSDVYEIRKKYSDGNITQKDLGSQYNVSQAAVYRIVNNQVWKHI